MLRYKRGDVVKIAPKAASPERWRGVQGIVEGVPEWAASAWKAIDTVDPVYLVSWDGDRLYALVKQSLIARAG